MRISVFIISQEQSIIANPLIAYSTRRLPLSNLLTLPKDRAIIAFQCLKNQDLFSLDISLFIFISDFHCLYIKAVKC